LLLGAPIDGAKWPELVKAATFDEMKAAGARIKPTVLASLIDTAGSMSVIAQTGNSVVTVDLRTDYHRPAMGAMLCARGTIVKFGRQLSSVDVRILDSGKHLIASGRVVLMNTVFTGAAGRSQHPGDA
jgi:uncharacterized protein (TIGR00369 family)